MRIVLLGEDSLGARRMTGGEIFTSLFLRGGEDALSTRDVTREREKTRGGGGKGNFSPSRSHPSFNASLHLRG